MSHLDYTPKNKKGQHLNYEERQKIEILLKAGHKPEEIDGCSLMIRKDV